VESRRSDVDANQDPADMQPHRAAAQVHEGIVAVTGVPAASPHR
jgi:hypothetical protein